MPSRSPTHSALSLWESPHGLPEFSIERKAVPSSEGKSDSMSARYRLISRILSRISMFTGHISSHARQLVQAQSSSPVILSNMEFAGIVISASTPKGGETTGSPVAAITSPVLSTISRGSSGFPVA